MSFEVYSWTTVVIMFVGLLTAVEVYKPLLKRKKYLTQSPDYVFMYFMIFALSAFAPFILPCILAFVLFLGVAKMLAKFVKLFIKVEE